MSQSIPLISDFALGTAQDDYRKALEYMGLQE